MAVAIIRATAVRQAANPGEEPACSGWTNITEAEGAGTFGLPETVLSPFDGSMSVDIMLGAIDQAV